MRFFRTQEQCFLAVSIGISVFCIAMIWIMF